VPAGIVVEARGVPVPDHADVECIEQVITTELPDVRLLPLAQVAALPPHALRHGLRRVLEEAREPVAAFQNSII
jgi:FXSXX-COOH protein